MGLQFKKNTTKLHWGKIKVVFKIKNINMWKHRQVNIVFFFKWPSTLWGTELLSNVLKEWAKQDVLTFFIQKFVLAARTVRGRFGGKRGGLLLRSHTPTVLPQRYERKIVNKKV